ncbi:MAG: hypothetical protein Q8Q26_13670 [Pseudorhodobacter sp.]|nr:hypothetical protein [Pseudorhodobacter sp.]
MSFAIVNAVESQPVAAGAQSLDAMLDTALADLPPDAPVLVMAHGYRYSPSHKACDPHRLILAQGCRSPAAAWPRRMGFGRGNAGEGLGIAFGWEAGGSLWRAYAEAGRAGRALATLIARIRAHHPGRVGILAHSLGARVALAALPLLAPRDVGRMILLAGAEFGTVAATALASPAGRCAEVLNVTSRENDLYDVLFERLLSPLDFKVSALGAGLELPNCATLQIDAPDHRAALGGLGYPTAPATRMICHWSGYLRPGLFPLYRAFLKRCKIACKSDQLTGWNSVQN